MPNQNIGLRIDTDLLAQVDALAEQLGQTRTAIITEALHQRLGLPVGGSVEQRLADVEQRLNSVEQRLAAEVRAAAQLGLTRAEPTPQATSAPTPRRPRQQGMLSDATLRRHWEKAGRPGAGFHQWAAAEGWVGQGKGNQRQWQRPGG